jgi:hypothetical protein
MDDSQLQFNIKLARLELYHATKSFNTKVLVQDKVLLTVFDHDLAYNVVGESIVEKLGITTTSHPAPYQLSFMKERVVVEVTKQAMISFSLPPYHGTILCDVVPIRDIRLILGKPWAQDESVTYCPKMRSYSMSHGRRKLIFTPLSQDVVLEIKVKLDEKRRLEMSEQKSKVPTNIRSSMNSLATPWLDAFPMVPSCLSFLLHEEDKAVLFTPSGDYTPLLVEAEKDAFVMENVTPRELEALPPLLISQGDTSAPLREVSCTPLFHIYDYVLVVSHAFDQRVSFVFHAFVTSRTKYSCFHFSSLSQYMSSLQFFYHEMYP